MRLSDEQIALLNAPLNSSHVKSRSQSGRSLSYVEGWHVIAEANRIFGFDGWSRETIELKMVSESARTIGASKANGWGVTYSARVRVTVDGDIIREGCGTGHGIDRDLGLAHESALKEAETDAMKRAFMTFGNQFGLALYDKTQANVVDFSEANEAPRQNPHVTRPEDVSDAKPRYDGHGNRIDWIDTSAHRVERLSKAKARPVAATLNEAMRQSTTEAALIQFGIDNAEAVASLPLDWEEIFQSRYQEFLDELRSKREAAE